MPQFNAYPLVTDPQPVDLLLLFQDSSGAVKTVTVDNLADAIGDIIGASAGAPSTAKYLLNTPDAGLSSAQSLSELATGILKTTTGTGIVSSVPAPTGAIVGDTDAQSLSNKTLVSPRITTGLLDLNGNELFLFTATASAVNELTYANAATGNSPTFAASGGDANVGITITPKGTGSLNTSRLRLGSTVSDGTIPLIIKQSVNSNAGSQRMYRSDNDNYACWYLGGDDKGYFDNRAPGGWEFYGAPSGTPVRLGGFSSAGVLDAVGKITTADTTASTSTTTGSGIFAGGVGIAGALNVGGAITGSNLSGTNTGDQTITLTGDVTGSGTGSFAATIANSAVTLAKMADMATASLLGRNSGGTGAPEVLSASTTKTLLSLNLVENTALSTWAGSANITTLGTIATGVWNGTTIAVANGGTGNTSYTKGDILVASAATTLTKLPVGANNLVLTADSAEATGMKWASVAGTGDVVGPASATDNALARYDLATGKLIQNSVVTVSDAGATTGITDLNATGIRTWGGASIDTASAVATSGAVNIDFTKPLTTQALVGATTWTFTGSPVANQKTIIRVSADGTNRVVTLPANVFEVGKTSATAAFTVPANTTWEIFIEFITGTTFLIANLPPQVTGTGGVWVQQTSPALITPDLGTPSAINLSNGTALPVSSLTAGVLAANVTLGELAGQIVLDPALSADGRYSGISEAGTAGTTLAFGDLVYLAVADSRWELTDADADATSGAVKIGICVLAAAADGDPTTILLWGKVRADTAFPTLTVGAPAYISTTAGGIQVAQPSGTDDVIRIVGYGNTADELFFCPSADYMTHT